jgi:hypothetical protein
MKTFLTCLLSLALLSVQQAFPASQALALHPENPHYFLFHGEPTVLVTSGEHYGAVLNLDFNYLTYLNTLRKDGLNLTRTFTGAYVEPMGAFNIAQNTLAPKGERFICPWARSSTPGYANGGNKFDLSKWDDAYFKRLNDFVRQASRRRVVVEMNLFCPFYEEAQWKISPQNAVNNINNVGAIPRTNVYTLDQHGGLLAIQEALVRKIVTELKDSDNVYYELCNEPYFGGVTIEWQHHIADVIVDTEKQLGVKHLISQNIANNKAIVQKPHPGVSIFNFHYASPPETVSLNYGLNKAIGDNETGFKGTNDTHYRMEAWEFMLAGGALYNNLDYSFVAGHEKGDFAYPKNQPGGGSPAFRGQMKTLQEFLNSFEFIRMKPDKSILKGGLPEKAHAQILAETGRQYAIYIFGGEQAKLALELPADSYKVEWLSPFTGKTEKKETLKHAGGIAQLTSPSYKTDIALKITR